MRLGPRSREILELLAGFGFDALEGALRAPALYRSLGFSSERTLRERAKSLDQNGWIVWDDSRQSGNWVAKLTRAGQSALDGGWDPQAAWEEEWDGKWRMLSFDLPASEHVKRHALNEWLESLRFGRLQGSVRISPRDLGSWTLELKSFKVDPTAVVFIVGEFGGASTDRDYVERAWDFKSINANYARYLDFLDANSPERTPQDDFASWFRRECALWRTAFDADPFLPKALWPQGFRRVYLGPSGVKRRKESYAEWKAILNLGA